MIKAFNCFQFVALFMSMPWIISWLSTNPFPNAAIAGFIAYIMYGIMAIMSIVFMYAGTERNAWL